MEIEETCQIKKKIRSVWLYMFGEETFQFKCNSKKKVLKENQILKRKEKQKQGIKGHSFN